MLLQTVESPSNIAKIGIHIDNARGTHRKRERINGYGGNATFEVETSEKIGKSKETNPNGVFRRFYLATGLFQFKALFIKDMQLHSKHVYANLCHVSISLTQIFTPVLILVLLKLLMDRAADIVNLTTVDFQKRSLVPIVHNMPISLVQQSTFYPIAIDTCQKWFAYDYDESLVKLDRLSLIEKIISDPMREYCPELGRHTPYFKRSSPKGIVPDLSETIDKLNKQEYKFGREVSSVGEIPDGSVLFKDLDSDLIDIRLMVNDMPLSEYHSNNGITKSSFKLSQTAASKVNEAVSMRKHLRNTNATWPVDLILMADALCNRRPHDSDGYCDQEYTASCQS